MARAGERLRRVALPPLTELPPLAGVFTTRARSVVLYSEGGADWYPVEAAGSTLHLSRPFDVYRIGAAGCGNR